MISFPAVSVKSFLTVIVMEKGILTDTVLGEVFLPLEEIDERAQIDTTDSRHYYLSRRKASHRVSGSIELSIGWRSTPLDRLTLHVKDLQEELDDLEELLAMMIAKENPQQEEILLSQMYRTLSELTPTRSVAGKLEVKIIEARNLSIPVDRMKSFANAGVYANVILEKDSGRGMPLTTSTAKNRLAPSWGESFKLENVEQNSQLLIQLFDVRRIRTNEFLGQVNIAIFSLKVQLTVLELGWMFSVGWQAALLLAAVEA